MTELKSTRWYVRYHKFIDALRVRSLPSEVLVEHHIVPTSLGGRDILTNRIRLTLREHYVAHLMLWKAHRGKMTMAFSLMTSQRSSTLTSRGYYRNVVEDLSERTSHVFSEEDKKKISEGGKKRWETYVMPDEEREARRQSGTRDKPRLARLARAGQNQLATIRSKESWKIAQREARRLRYLSNAK